MQLGCQHLVTDVNQLQRKPVLGADFLVALHRVRWLCYVQIFAR
jgi:hypothetical protein